MSRQYSVLKLIAIATTVSKYLLSCYEMLIHYTSHNTSKINNLKQNKWTFTRFTSTMGYSLQALQNVCRKNSFKCVWNVQWFSNFTFYVSHLCDIHAETMLLDVIEKSVLVKPLNECAEIITYEILYCPSCTMQINITV